MNKLMKIMSLVAMIMMISSCIVFAQNSKATNAVYNWQVLDVGPAENSAYAFDVNTIKYARNADGSINTPVLVRS